MLFRSTQQLAKTINHSPYFKQSIKLSHQPQYNFLWWGKKKNQETVDSNVEIGETVKVESLPQTEQLVQQQTQQNITQEQVIANTQQINQELQQQQNEVQLNAESSIQGEELSGLNFKIDGAQYYQNSYVNEMDLGNVASSIQPLNEYQHMDILSKFSYISPGSLYDSLDQFSRDCLFYLADTQGLGLGLSIAACSLGIKLIFMPIMTATQINAHKMKLIDPEMKNFQNQTSALQKRGDHAGVRAAQAQFSELRKKYGIHNWVSVAGLGQIPFLITWFLSLRYVCQMPDKYPGLRTEGLLWFQDLSEADPYYILPLISATLSHFNIGLNPNLQSSAGSNFFSKYMKYFKYVPFMTLPIAAFFPAGLNVYWAITAFTHLSVALLVKSNFMRRNVFKIPEYLPGSILEKLNQKHTQRVIKTNIIDNNKQKQEMAQRMAQTLTGKKIDEKVLNNKAQQAAAPGVKVFTNKPTKKQPQQEGGVKVFTNKPSKKKKN